ncbi:M14 family zinc carboxypeptidase [Microbispora bryophytorum]|uniref:M14 family zinc carboxypeptidase n=1 Tax=Microbispora bryophytorum TaxID=1460882 RepID=UPI0033C2388A
MSSGGTSPSTASVVRKRVVTLALGVGFLGGLGIPAAGADVAAAASGPQAVVQEQAPSLPSGRTTYRTITDYNDEMVALTARHPGLVKHITLPHKTRQGREVYGIEVTHDVDAADGKPVLLMMGVHHGNEWPSGEHTMEFAYDLIGNDGTDPRITRLLDTARVIFVPVVNVDGFVINRRTSCGLSPACASNAGVDINRNYPFGWGSNAGSNATTRGPGPGSEPEVQNIMDLTKNNQVTVLITNHTSGHTVLRPPLEKRAGDAPDEAVYAALTDAITAENGYTGMKSGFDYETTGETPDWSYYATRGLGFTFEIMKTQSTNNTYSEVIEDYTGTGRYEGKSNREAFMVALEYAADPAAHSVITGKAPKGAVLKVTKDFDLWTAPIRQSGDVVDPPQRVPTHLESTLVAPTNGKFAWHVNPSVRPAPAYTEAGVVATGPGNFIKESWTLTCARPTGEVLETVHVTVDRGEQADVRLQECKTRFNGNGPKN